MRAAASVIGCREYWSWGFLEVACGQFGWARIASLFWPKFYELLKSKLGDDLDEILDNYNRKGYKFPRRPAAADGVTPCAKKRKAAA